jgi:hypothetical protein
MNKEEAPADTPALSRDNVENLRTVISGHKNLLVCGVKGVGKITNTIRAVSEKTNVYYIGNPVDFEGKNRPGSYDKYLRYISSLKKDITIVKAISELFEVGDDVILIIDEIFGRGPDQLEQIRRVLDMQNVRVVLIVGCIKYTGEIVDKMDVILELHLDGAHVIDKDLARAICRILGGAEPKGAA